MREIVPNQYAQDFLKQLLDRYSQGDSFPTAFKYARQSLKLSSGGFDRFADWLPILFHNYLSNDVTWQDLSATAFSRLVPPQVTATCRYLSQPNHRMLTNVALSLIGSLLSINLQTQPQITNWENAIVDRVQLAQVESLQSPSQVTIVWAINFEIGNESTIFDNHIIQGCSDEYVPNPNPLDRPQLDKCDRQLLNSIVKLDLNDSNSQDFRLNPNLLRDPNQRIDRVNLTDIKGDTKSEIEINQLFNNKFVIVGHFNEKEINSVARIAIAIDQITRANDKQHPLPLSSSRSIGEQWLWIFAWLILTGILVRYPQWKLLLMMSIGGQIAIALILLNLGKGLPIIVTSIAMILVGGTLRGIIVTSPNNHSQIA